MASQIISADTPAAPDAISRIRNVAERVETELGYIAELTNAIAELAGSQDATNRIDALATVASRFAIDISEDVAESLRSIAKELCDREAA